MHRRLLVGLIGLSPLALIASKIPAQNTITEILIKRWKQSKTYTMAVLNAMPAADMEYASTKEQMTFAQHFMHLGLINNFYIGILRDSDTYPDFNALIQAPFLIERPDPINLFQPDVLEKRDPETNKTLVATYVASTFDYVLSSLEKVQDSILTQGIDKEKPEFLSGHTNLDLILRGESHTAHHRAQAIGYLRMKGIRPPGYTVNNKFNN